MMKEKMENEFETEQINYMEEVGIAERIQLLMLYQSERQQRDINFWKQIFMYFIGVICIEILPLAYEKYLNELPTNLPLKAYQIVGIILSVLEIFVIYAYKVRFDAINKSYKKVMETIPEKLRRKSLDEYKISGFVKLPMTIIVGYCMVGIQIFFGIVLFLYFK